MDNRKDHICQCLGRILVLRHRTAVMVSGNQVTTGEQFVRGVVGLANGLRELGVGRGDVVAIVSLNSEWYVQWLLAVLFVGGIVAPLNYRWSLEEARRAMEVVRPVMLVMDKSCRECAMQLQQLSLRYHVLMGDHPLILNSYHKDVNEGTFARALKVSTLSLDYVWAPRDIALICFTSGTTGRPKGVAISHSALLVQSLAKISIVGYGENDVYLHTAPLCHIGGLSSCIAVLTAGGCHVFIPKFDAQEALQLIQKNHVTSFITVPAMMVDLVSAYRFHTTGGSGDSVRKVLNGGGSLSPELIRSAATTFPQAKLFSAYGMTEACSSLTFITLHDPTNMNPTNVWQNICGGKYDPSEHHLGGTCVGKPPSHIDLQIRGDDDNETCFSGRIFTRGSHVMVRYWNETSMTRSASDWLDTGDMGWIDATGNLWLLGRTKDMIKSGGENVYPEEMERMISQHPGVSSVVVFGIPDYRLTEMVVACVIPRENWKWTDQKISVSPDSKYLSSEILQKHCVENNLTRFKLPRMYIASRKPFPRTTTGKLRRDEVRKEVMSSMQLLPSNL